MALSNDLASQFVKATKNKTETKKESTVYGMVVNHNGKEYVQLDGSELLTPVSSTTVVNEGDRVMVTIKNHEAIVTGDLTNPSASDKEVKEIGSKITEFEIIIGDKVVTEDLEAINAYIENIKGITAKYEELEAITAEIETLQAKYADMEYITAGDVEIINAEIESLQVKLAEFQSISTDDLEAINAEFANIIAYNGSFTYLSADKLRAIDADIENLKANSITIENGKIHFAQIDFSNIGEAAIEKLFADSGIIQDLIMSEGKVTGELVGVTLKGDLIEAGTLKADKLVILGEDGLYYKLNIDALGEATVSSDPKYQNGLDGTVILAESITAEKIAVDDLVAFGATIGGFHITENSLYSGTKNAVDSDNMGIHLSSDGQIVAGDASEFLKYYIDENENYALEISASSISLGTFVEQIIMKPVLDEEGNPVMEPVLDESGNPVLDENGDPVMEPVMEPQLDEDGNPVTETVREDLDLKSISDTVTNLELNNEGIKTTVSNMSDDISGLRESVESKVSADEVEIAIKSELQNFGATKVETTTGFKFNEEGLTIAKSDKELSTNIDEDGMSIYKNNEDEVLTANSEGVNAYNLHARTYLIIGDTSRFEDFVKNGKKRTGCFWIG